jgi:hypothetical protein
MMASRQLSFFATLMHTPGRCAIDFRHYYARLTLLTGFSSIASAID